MMMRRVLTFLMAGGKGERLWPLTRDRAKPAVPFGGIYRIIDFTLSNCINSGIRRIHVLIQYKSISLQRHLRMGWNIFNSELGEYIDVIPAQQRIGSDWYRGTADAIYQNIYTIEQEHADEVLILAGDHVYKMNYYQMIDFHRKMGADVTVAVVRMPKNLGTQLGVVEVDKKGKILGFAEKPKKPQTIPDSKQFIFASMGIYLFNHEILEEELTEDAKKDTDHDFGKNIIPQMVKKRRKLFVYNFIDAKKQPQYWRDIGTIDAYYEANMELVRPKSEFNLYEQNWPIRTYQEQFPPAKMSFSGQGPSGRAGLVLDSLIAGGCIINGAKVGRSILSYNVQMHSFSEAQSSILMEGVNVRPYAKIKNAIIDKDVVIPESTVIGYDLEKDRKRFFVTESGIVVVAKGTMIK